MRWWEHVLATHATDTLATSSSARASAESCQVTCRIVVYTGAPPSQVGMKRTAYDHDPRCVLPAKRTKPWESQPLRTCLLDDRASGGVGQGCLAPTVDATAQVAQRLTCWYPEHATLIDPAHPDGSACAPSPLKKMSRTTTSFDLPHAAHTCAHENLQEP